MENPISFILAVCKRKRNIKMNSDIIVESSEDVLGKQKFTHWMIIESDEVLLFDWWAIISVTLINLKNAKMMK